MGKSIFEQMGGQYVRQGDYELPALTVQPEKEQEVGVWAQRHRKWLKGQHRVLYYNLLTSCKLYTHLGEVEERAAAMFNRLVSDMTKAEGVTEKLKAADMMSWVGRMNNIRSRATEIRQHRNHLRNLKGVKSMKNKLLSFVAGMLVTALIFGGSVTALASSNTFKIEGSPINVLVNGEVFKPKDVNGNDVLVFVYNGTTYAPLRALAEAYGLEVGYEGSKNLAIVTAPNAKPAQQAKTTVSGDFASAWTITEEPDTNYGDEKIFNTTYNGDLGMEDFKTWQKSFGATEIQPQAEALTAQA